MDFIDFHSFLTEYKTMLGGLAIAIATIVAVYFNYLATRRAERRLKAENTARLKIRN